MNPWEHDASEDSMEICEDCDRPIDKCVCEEEE
jgi:hypothetical protein